jgi:hypothetical protein
MGRLGHCDGCDRRLVPERPPAPMLHDHIWCQLADPREMLCVDCMVMRAAQHDIRLSLASLKPVPVNLVCNPWSWFDLFLNFNKNKLPRNFDLQAWRQAAERCSPQELPSLFRSDLVAPEQQFELPFGCKLRSLRKFPT